MRKLAVISSHPIQYHAPWFRRLAAGGEPRVKVFYLSDFGVTDKPDLGFGRSVKWDVPLLNGYEHEFVPNVSKRPGTHHFWGLNNPSLFERVSGYGPDATLLMGYNYASFFGFCRRWDRRASPLLFRGDSHRLVRPAGLKEALRRGYISMILRRFSAFLYVGKANYQYFRYHRVAPEKLFFGPHAVDNDRFISQADEAARQARLWKSELGIPAAHSVILFAGKFETKKRPLDLLRAFLSAGLPETSLLFVGGGHLEAELRREASGHRHVYFAPFQNQTLMPRTYAAADLFVLPSRGGSETWGLAVNEAMCMARPVVASDHVGCAQDLIRPHENGLIFPAGDAGALAACLQEALSDRGRLRLWGEQSRNIIKSYSYDQVTEGLRQSLAYVGAERGRAPLAEERVGNSGVI